MLAHDLSGQPRFEHFIFYCFVCRQPQSPNRLSGDAESAAFFDGRDFNTRSGPVLDIIAHMRPQCLYFAHAFSFVALRHCTGRQRECP